MSKDIPESVLIELARKAKKIEPEPEHLDGKKLRRTDPHFTLFIDALDIKAGRNPVSAQILFEAFEIWSEQTMDYPYFCKKLNKLFKNSTKSIYKLNMKPITILEKAKEVKQHEQKEQTPLS